MGNTNDYFYGNEVDRYLYYQIPVVLVKEPKFKPLSGDAKLLYGLLLNRTSLSNRNNWRDEQGRVYVIYTLDEIMDDINCSEKKAIKLTNELKDVDLIETVRRGLNKPNIIYVKNFATALKYQKQPPSPVNTRNNQNDSSRTVKKTDFRTVKMTAPELSKRQPIYNDFSNNYLSNNNVRESAPAPTQNVYGEFKDDIKKPCPCFPDTEKPCPVNRDNNNNSIKNNNLNNNKERESAPAPASYGEFKTVILTEPEYSGLVQAYGKEKTDDYINRLDIHIASSGTRYKNHYATIIKWVIKDTREHLEGKKQAKKGKLSNYEERNTDYDELERKEQEQLIKEHQQLLLTNATKEAEVLQ